MPRSLALVLSIVILLVGGVAHGLYGERWANPVALEAAVARIENVPLEIGDWQAQPGESDPEAFEQAGARGYSVRVYTHQRTKASILVILMCGRPGKMAVHTPEVCYQGAGYEMRGDPVRHTLPGGGDTFWAAKFSKPTGLTTDLRLVWSWATHDVWEAPDNPRWHFRGQPYLYKLYLSQDLTGQPATGASSDTALDFLRVLTPELRRTLFAAAAD